MIAELFDYLTKTRESRAGFFILLSGGQSPNKSTTDSNTHTPKNRAKRSMGLIRSSDTGRYKEEGKKKTLNNSFEQQALHVCCDC
jgi:hypothetical protein